jgi:hypothetical protein
MRNVNVVMGFENGRVNVIMTDKNMSWGLGCSSGVEHLLSTLKALGSITALERKKKKGREEGKEERRKEERKEERKEGREGGREGRRKERGRKEGEKEGRGNKGRKKKKIFLKRCCLFYQRKGEYQISPNKASWSSNHSFNKCTFPISTNESHSSGDARCSCPVDTPVSASSSRDPFVSVFSSVSQENTCHWVIGPG